MRGGAGALGGSVLEVVTTGALVVVVAFGLVVVVGLGPAAAEQPAAPAANSTVTASARQRGWGSRERTTVTA
jgi:hypothetical protein